MPAADNLTTPLRADSPILRARADALAARPVTHIDPVRAAHERAMLEQRQAERAQTERLGAGPTRLETDKPTPAPAPRAAGNVVTW